MRVSTSHGSSHVWCVSGTPSTRARRCLHVALPVPPWPVRVRLAPTDGPWDDVVHFQHVAELQRRSAVAALPRLPLQPRGHARGDARIMPLSCAPLPLIAIVGTPSRLHLDVATNRPLRVEREAPPTAPRHAVDPSARLPPILLTGPCTRLVRLAKPAPRPQVVAQRCVHCLARVAATDRRAVVAPSPHDRVEGLHQPFLSIRPMSPDPCGDLPFGRRHGLAARGDDGLIPARGRRGVVPEGESPNVNPGSTRFDGQQVWSSGLCSAAVPTPSRAMAPPSTPDLARSRPDPGV